METVLEIIFGFIKLTSIKNGRINDACEVYPRDENIELNFGAVMDNPNELLTKIIKYSQFSITNIFIRVRVVII